MKRMSIGLAVLALLASGCGREPQEPATVTVKETTSPYPVVIRIETRGGHGAGKPTWMRIEEMADRFAFLREALGMNLDD